MRQGPRLGQGQVRIIKRPLSRPLSRTRQEIWPVALSFQSPVSLSTNTRDPGDTTQDIQDADSTSQGSEPVTGAPCREVNSKVATAPNTQSRR